jgi:dipeptidyl aminopeptidase/acylaminoacyl peptidase
MSDFEKYLAIEEIGGPRFHPKQNRLAFVYDAPGLLQIYTTPVEENRTNWAKRETFSVERCTAARYLSDGTLLFVTDFGGDENFQIGLITQNGEQVIVSTDKKAKHNINAASDNYIYFSANITNKAKFDIYRQKIPLSQNRPEMIYSPEKGMVALSLASNDDDKLVIVNYFSNTHMDLILKDMRNDEVWPMTEHFNPSQWDAVRFLDDETLLVFTNYSNDFVRPAMLRLDGTFAPYTKLDAMQVQFDAYTFSEESANTYITINEEGYSKLFEARFTTTDAFLEEIALPDKGVMLSADQRRYVNAMSLNFDETLLAIAHSTPSSPTDIHIINLETNNTWKATSASHPGLSLGAFRDCTLHRFNSFDGLSVPYFQYLPKSDRPQNEYPTVFIIHGGPEAQARPRFSQVTQFFLSEGFAVIEPNIRGSAGYGRTYMDLDNKGKRLDSIKDIEHLVLHIREQEEFDGNNFIVYGGSYGGFAVLSAMTEHPHLWRGGVDLYGIANFVTFLENTADWRRALREAEYGSLSEDLEMLKSISPIHKFDQIKAPLFILQGDNDERVPLSESTQMYNQLTERGIPVEFMRFDNEGHGITYIENKLKAYPAILKWMKNLVTQSP